MLAIWIPVLPSVLLDPEQVLKVKVFEQELAVWRSASGRVQIWENRCPHRSVRLTLGKVRGENLVCAYHGWAFEADTARCQRIPAQPEQRAPQSLCAKVYMAIEAQAMVWFAGFISHKMAFEPLADSSASHYAGSIITHCTQQDIQQKFLSMGLTANSPYVWHGNLQNLMVNIFISPSHPKKQHLHLLCDESTSSYLGVEILLSLRNDLEHAIDTER